MKIYEAKLVPIESSNADGRFVVIKATCLKFGQIIGDEFVVWFEEEQPFYQWGGHSKPDITLQENT
jgi:hypothetical protein